jgi:CarD family transcriptional regulator
MNYNPGDAVLYSGSVCTITGTEIREIGGMQVAYYVLQPEQDERTLIFLPVDNPNTQAKLKPILDKEQARDILDAMATVETNWITDEAERRAHFRKIIEAGDRTELVRLIKSIRQKKAETGSKKRKTRTADEHSLQAAEKILYDEISSVLGITPQEVEQVLADGELDSEETA